MLCNLRSDARHFSPNMSRNMTLIIFGRIATYQRKMIYFHNNFISPSHNYSVSSRSLKRVVTRDVFDSS